MNFQNSGEAARWWIKEGYWPVPVPLHKKKPELSGWPHLRIDENNVGRFFNGVPQNIGVLLGDANQLVDIDLDCPEALAVASTFLPSTGLIFGRNSKPASHRFYRCDAPQRTVQFHDPMDKSHMLVELRGWKKTDGEVGLQTIVPPSIHSSGEPIQFQPGYDRTPATVVAASLGCAVRKVAAAAALARHWPAHGRHAAMLALAGLLARADWPMEEASTFCRAVYSAVATHDPAAIGRSDSELRDSYAKVSMGVPATGIPTLTQAMDPKIVGAVLEWLGIARGQAPSWKDSLVVTKDGGYKAVVSNAAIFFRHSPEWQDVLSYNEFSLYTVTKKAAPWPQSKSGANWTDYDDVRACEWLQHQGVLVNTHVAAEAVQTVAKENGFHPVKDYLNNIVWDQAPRIDRWLTDYLGAQDTQFIRAIGARWLISAVARIMRPGCQVDHVLLLEGPQGIRKSTALRVLAGAEWFSDHVSELGSKDSRLELHGKWILEMAELDRVRRADIERIKNFLTTCVDNFRAPYGRRTENIPRSCVFAASVNDQTPLTDETGNRRFWPVRCGTIDIDKLEAERDQLWGEAYQRYGDGAVWYLDTPELNQCAEREQDERYATGPWDDVILDWVDDPKQSYEKAGAEDTALPLEPFDSDRNMVTITDILLHAIGKPLDRITLADQLQVQRCLTHAKWIRRQRRYEGGRKWFYLRPEQTAEEGEWLYKESA